MKRKPGVNKPGWDGEIKDAKKKARRAFQSWRLLGKPRQGMEFDEMVKTRICFKRALKSWRKKKDTIFGRKLAENLENGNHVNFWRTLNRGASNESQARFCSSKIGQACTESDILNLWRDHFSQIVNSHSEDEMARSKLVFEKELRECERQGRWDMWNISISLWEVRKAADRLWNRKAPGPDGILAEHKIWWNGFLNSHGCAFSSNVETFVY